VSENVGITLFAMLMEIRKNVNDSPESYIFLFDINQWYKSKMPSHINNFKVSNAYATFVKLPDYASYLDFNISVKTLRPFDSSLRNNIKKLFYPSSIYFGNINTVFYNSCCEYINIFFNMFFSRMQLLIGHRNY